jgi:hypothetical protein
MLIAMHCMLQYFYDKHLLRIGGHEHAPVSPEF